MAGREGKRKPVPRLGSFRSVAGLMLIPLCAFAAFFAYRYVRDLVLRPHPAEFASPAARTQRKPHPRRAEAPAAVPQPKRVIGRIALILDDVGFDNQPLAGAMKIDRNLSFSVLPNAQNAREAAEILHGNGFEVMCHLPMEPVDYPYHAPGAHAIMMSMSDEEIAATTRHDIASVPHAAGMNNHMGSRATADRRVMRSVLGALPRGMFFVDSVTTGDSIAGRMAREMRIPTADRKVFLDDVQTEGEVRRQLSRLVAAARESGVAVGIGHMYPVTVKVLIEDLPALRSKGFRFVRASEAVR